MHVSGPSQDYRMKPSENAFRNSIDSYLIKFKNHCFPKYGMKHFLQNTGLSLEPPVSMISVNFNHKKCNNMTRKSSFLDTRI